MQSSPYLPHHQGVLCCLSALFFQQVFRGNHLWKCRKVGCWRSTRHKVTVGLAENGSQETAAWQPGPAKRLFVLSTATTPGCTTTTSQLVGSSATVTHCGGTSIHPDAPAEDNTSRAPQMALSTWGCDWRAESAIIGSVCEGAGVE